MKYAKDSPGNMALVPLECQNPNMLKCYDKNVAVARAVQREKHKSKRREKENLWRKKNFKNSRPEPIVIHFPARSALQTIEKDGSRNVNGINFLDNFNEDWMENCFDTPCIKEWMAANSKMSIEKYEQDNALHTLNKEETEYVIRDRLKAIMKSVDIDEVTPKYLRGRLEEDLNMELDEYKSYIDQEMLVILGQMDEASEIFPHVYLGSEWNASNLEELENNGVGYILNVTKEIDNFYPGVFDYLKIRVSDNEKTELMKHWESTFRYISQVKERGSKVLVHCKMGISRSASVVIAYAMKEFNMSLDEARHFVKKRRNCIKPNKAFCSQLKTYEGILDASRQRHNSLWNNDTENNLQASLISKLKQRNNQKSNSDDTSCNNKKKSNKYKSSVKAMSTSRYNCQLSFAQNMFCDVNDENQGTPSWSLAEQELSISQSANHDDTESWNTFKTPNAQSWRAHVTLQQNNLRKISVDGAPVHYIESPTSGAIEAISKQNLTSTPLYYTEESPTDIEDILEPVYFDTENEELDPSFCASVKERIEGFEKSLHKAQSLKKDPEFNVEDISPSSNDVLRRLSTVELDKVIEVLLNRNEVFKDGAPLLSETKLAAQKQRALLISSEEWPETEIQESMDVNDSLVDAPKENELYKDVYTDLCNTEGRNFSRRSSTVSMNDHENPRLPFYERQDSVELYGVKKEDLFSVKLDNAFEREERRGRRSGVINTRIDLRGTLSRNSSWGSFDSAVVLNDRDSPSRQSSWGSADTRGTSGNVVSRNSSFGSYDMRQHHIKESLGETHLESNCSDSVFEKDNSIRAYNDLNEMEFCDEGLVEDINLSKLSPTTPTETLTPMELGHERLTDASRRESMDFQNSPLLTVCIPKSTNITPLARSQSDTSCITLLQKHDSGNPRNPSDDLAIIPGMVKKQKILLEEKSQENIIGKYRRSLRKLSRQLAARSRSSCDPTRQSYEKAICRYSEENKASFREPFETNVENRKSGRLTELLESKTNGKTSKTLKGKRLKKRSQSLDRYELHPSLSSPVEIYNEIVDKPILSVEKPTDDDDDECMKEICVRSLVGKFEEEAKEKEEKWLSPVTKNRNNRAKSDNSTPERSVASAPQRKTSLDHDLKLEASILQPTAITLALHGKIAPPNKSLRKLHSGKCNQTLVRSSSERITRTKFPFNQIIENR